MAGRMQAPHLLAEMAFAKILHYYDNKIVTSFCVILLKFRLIYWFITSFFHGGGATSNPCPPISGTLALIQLSSIVLVLGDDQHSD